MKIDELKETETTVETLDPAQEIAMRQRFVIKFRDVLCFLRKYMNQNHYTLGDLRNQVIEKTSHLSKSQRDFLAMWKIEFIQQCFDELNKIEREAYERRSRTNNVVEKSS